MKRVLILFLAVSILLLLSIQSEAFDGNRKGFTLGGGLGLGFVRYENKSHRHQNNFSLMIDLKAGYGIGNQTVVWLTSKSAWLSEQGIISAHTYGLAEINYYLRSNTPSIYLVGGLGMVVVGNRSDVDPGPGFLIGLRYQGDKHGALEFNLLYGRPESRKVTFTDVVLRIMLMVTAY